MSDPLSNPATPDLAPVQMAVVQSIAGTIQQGANVYPVAAGTVLRLLMLPAITTFRAPPRTHLIVAGGYKLGDIVPPPPA